MFALPVDHPQGNRSENNGRHETLHNEQRLVLQKPGVPEPEARGAEVADEQFPAHIPNLFRPPQLEWLSGQSWKETDRKEQVERASEFRRRKGHGKGHQWEQYRQELLPP